MSLQCDRVFTGLCNADMVCVKDGKIIGEIQAISYQELSTLVAGTLILNKEINNYTGFSFDISINCMNTYGSKEVITITDVTISNNNNEELKTELAYIFKGRKVNKQCQ